MTGERLSPARLTGLIGPFERTACDAIFVVNEHAIPVVHAGGEITPRFPFKESASFDTLKVFF